MEKVLSKVLSILNIVLSVIAFSLVAVGVATTYARLEKSLLLAIPTFIPFIIFLVFEIINITSKKIKVKENLFFNFTAFLLLGVTIIICVRSKLDINLIQYYRYGINYNPQYLSDNLSTIKICFYLMCVSNIMCYFISLLSQTSEEVKEEKIIYNENLEKEDILNEQEILENKELEEL